MAIQRRLVALVVADVVGYPRLIERDEVSVHERLRKLKTELIDREIAEPGARIVQTTGDGILVGFSSVTSPLHCAVEIQREMGVRNLYVAPDDKIQFRIAINLGDIIVEGDDILGDGVNVPLGLKRFPSRAASAFHRPYGTGARGPRCRVRRLRRTARLEHQQAEPRVPGGARQGRVGAGICATNSWGGLHV